MGGLERDRVYVQKFDADGDKVGGQFAIPGAVHDANGHSSFSQSLWLPSIAALENGGFAVEYNDIGFGTDYTNGSHYSSPWTWTAIFDASGMLVDQETPIGLPVSGDDQSNTIWTSAVAPDGAGGYHHGMLQAVSYEEGPSGIRIVLDGVEVTRHQGIFSNATEGYGISAGTIDVADHADGAVAIYTRSYYTNAPERTDIWAIDSMGFEFRVNDATDGFQQFGQTGDFLVQLSNGDYVAVWNDTSGADEATDRGDGRGRLDLRLWRQ